ncbi:hypothetical protein EXU57_13710 [Segetibacter sp. 3557_3]|nr:hypothetical protein EXU57_13710 [Segetibacter sp. 3557_3]
MQLKNIYTKLRYWENWPYLAKYIPLSPFWFWYCLRARSLWFFTPSNPSITFGGFEGEGKREMYAQLPEGTYPRSIYVQHDELFTLVLERVKAAGFEYPFAVKPDVGMMGLMFRQIHNDDQFKRYHELMPSLYIVQEMVNFPLEVSVFYFRYPWEQTGTITGFLKKEFLEVIGDGRSTLLQLLERYERVTFRLDEMKVKHREKLGEILKKGERYCLSYALNLSRGGKLVSLAHEIDEPLTALFDKLSLETGTFYYGRYDIRCASIEALKRGREYSILEYNGCGAEPHHIYGNGNSLLKAYKIVLFHWKVLYRISRFNHANGHPTWTYRQGLLFLRAARKHFSRLKQLDKLLET